MTSTAQSSQSRSATSADADSAPEEPRALDEIIELNNKFAKAILEASESYLRAMSSAQEHLWSPVKLSHGFLDSASAEALAAAKSALRGEDDYSAVAALDPDERVSHLKPEPADNLVRLHSGENPHTKKSRIQHAWAQRVSSQYMAEAQRLLDVAQKTEHGRWSPVMSPAAERDGTADREQSLSPSTGETRKG